MSTGGAITPSPNIWSLIAPNPKASIESPSIKCSFSEHNCICIRDLWYKNIHILRPTDTSIISDTPAPVTATMSLWQSYRNLTPRTRLIIGGGVMAYAAFGLLASDQAESLLGWTATDKDRKRLKEDLPKVLVVDRKDK